MLAGHNQRRRPCDRLEREGGPSGRRTLRRHSAPDSRHVGGGDTRRAPDERHQARIRHKRGHRDRVQEGPRRGHEHPGDPEAHRRRPQASRDPLGQEDIRFIRIPPHQGEGHGRLRPRVEPAVQHPPGGDSRGRAGLLRRPGQAFHPGRLRRRGRLRPRLRILDRRDPRDRKRQADRRERRGPHRRVQLRRLRHSPVRVLAHSGFGQVCALQEGHPLRQPLRGQGPGPDTRLPAVRDAVPVLRDAAREAREGDLRQLQRLLRRQHRRVPPEQAGRLHDAPQGGRARRRHEERQEHVLQRAQGQDMRQARQDPGRDSARRPGHSRGEDNVGSGLQAQLRGGQHAGPPPQRGDTHRREDRRPDSRLHRIDMRGPPPGVLPEHGPRLGRLHRREALHRLRAGEREERGEAHGGAPAGREEAVFRQHHQEGEARASRHGIRLHHGAPGVGLQGRMLEAHRRKMGGDAAGGQVRDGGGAP